MIYINHRINTIEQLQKVPLQNGIELDIRYHNNDLILHHDPFHHHETDLQKFDDFLKYWNHAGPMILNIKTEGIEHVCIDLMKKYQVKNWFFLGLSMPYFITYTKHAASCDIAGFSIDNLAVYFSEYEPMEYALAFAGKAKWIWIDCFTYLPIDKKIYMKLKKAGFKICLVSPELQKHPIAYIKDFRKQYEEFDIDAVCTKCPDLWQQDIFKLIREE